MNRHRQLGPKVMDTLGDQFRSLVANLIKGNRKRAHSLAKIAREEIPSAGLSIAAQNLIEEMAQAQALKNSLINVPSIVPGIGTFLSVWLIGLEDFFLLDQSVTLIHALCILHGVDQDDSRAMEDFAIRMIGEVYGITGVDKGASPGVISKDFMTKMLPQKYLEMGMNRGLHKIAARILPIKRRSRLLPIGIGLSMSAYHAYHTIVSVGQLSLKQMPQLKLAVAGDR